MNGLLLQLLRIIGSAGDAGSTSGSLGARVNDALARLTTTIRDRMDAAISSRLTTINNSVQQGSTGLSGVTSATSTITSVDTAKSFIRHLGHQPNNPSGSDSATVELTNATTVTARCISTGTNVTVRWMVIERK